jgi:hypothetical protein
MLTREHADASERVADSADREQRISTLRGRLERVRLERAKALAGGDRRKAVQLGRRSESIESEIEGSRGTLADARRVASTGKKSFAREHHQEHERLLNAQAALPGSAVRGRSNSERRDYSRLAPLAGFAQQEYERLDPCSQRVARLQIDRELALRNELIRSRGERAGTVAVPGGRRSGHDVLSQPRQHGGSRHTSTPSQRPAPQESSVMRDALEIAAGRKRQLGRDHA